MMIHVHLKPHCLIIQYQTEDNYLGTVNIPTDPAAPFFEETVQDPHNNLIHEAQGFRTDLGEYNLQAYTVGMTASARRRNRMVS